MLQSTWSSYQAQHPGPNPVSSMYFNFDCAQHVFIYLCGMEWNGGRPRCTRLSVYGGQGTLRKGARVCWCTTALCTQGDRLCWQGRMPGQWIKAARSDVAEIGMDWHLPCRDRAMWMRYLCALCVSAAAVRKGITQYMRLVVSVQLSIFCPLYFWFLFSLDSIM